MITGCAVAPALLTATGFVNGRWQFSTTTESTPLDRSPKNLVQVIMSAAPTAVTNLVRILLWGAFRQMGEVSRNFYLFNTLHNFDNKTADIITKNCSLSIVLTATDQKPQKSLKRWYYPPSHCLNVMLSNMTFLMNFAVFDPSPLTLWINCSF